MYHLYLIQKMFEVSNGAIVNMWMVQKELVRCLYKQNINILGLYIYLQVAKVVQSITAVQSYGVCIFVFIQYGDMREQNK